MDEWKIRVAEEYAELKERYEKLKAYNIRREVARHIKPPKPICSEADAKERETGSYREDLMQRQQGIMGEYLHILELRAALDGIDLGTPSPRTT